jgi:hypothetical protein
LNDIHVAVHDLLHWLNEHGWRLFFAAWVIAASHGAARRPNIISRKDRF